MVQARLRAAVGVVALLVGLFAIAGTASAYTAGPGFAASDFATAFPNAGPGSTGPIGLAFDGSSLVVVDNFDGDIARFPSAGGDEPSNVIRPNAYPGSGGLSIFGGKGYLALWGNGPGIAVLDPTTGAETARILTSSRWLALAVNPADGQLYGNTNTSGIYRLGGLDTASPTATFYANSSAGGATFDGIAFGPDGTLYASSIGAGSAVWKIPPGGGAPVHVADVPNGDGIAYANGDAQTSPYLAVNGNDGNITKVDLATGSTSSILTGGSRGDFVTVGPDKCLYATQTDSVLKITKADGTCVFVPPAAPTQVVADPILLKLLPGLQVNLNGLRATLTSGAPAHGVPGKTVEFLSGSKVLCTGVTDANGVARCGSLLTNVGALLGLRYVARFDGDSSYQPASGTGTIALIGSLALL